MVANIFIVSIEIPQNCNIIIGHAHFIKTVEDLYETLAESGTALKFGIAFCEASGKCLVRSDGNDEELIKAAEKEALKIGAGHTFIIFLKNGYPINVLNRIKNVSEVCTIFAATANPLELIVAENDKGARGILGVIDGKKPQGIESEEDKQWRKDFLRKIGYKR
ncbi:MAG: adenosine-specific kinase [Candidatus Bilamarchaeaceae archaeon]